MHPHQSAFIPTLSILLLLFSLPGSAAHKQSTGTQTGTVQDARSHYPIKGAEVAIAELGLRDTTDGDGQFVFESVLPGLYTVTAHCLGYDTLQLLNTEIRAYRNLPVIVDMNRSESIQRLSKMTVRANKAQTKKSDQVNGVSTVTSFELNNTPGSMNDISRAIATQPSAVTGLSGDFDNNLYVRGGNSSENSFVIDGIEFENISHFNSIDESGGAIGFLNGALVRELDFYAGGMPASLPSRLSSVSEVNLREGSRDIRKHQVDINASGLGLTTEGPMARGKGSYLANARMVNLMFLKPFLTGIDGIPRYGDGLLKLMIHPTKEHQLSLLAIGAYDRYNEDGGQYYRADTTFKFAPTNFYEGCNQFGVGLSWDWRTERFRNRLLLSGTGRNEDTKEKFTDYDSDPLLQLAYTSPTAGHFVDDRKVISLQNDFSLYLRESDQADIGVMVRGLSYGIEESRSDTRIRYSYQPNELDSSVIDTIAIPYIAYDTDSALASMHVAAYGQYVFNQGPIKAVAGIRGDYYRLITDWGLSPRLALSFTPGAIGSFSVSGGLYYQMNGDFSQILSDLLAPNPNIDLYPVRIEDIHLQRNWQGILGYEKIFQEDFVLRAEAYYKFYDREYPFAEPNIRDYGIYFETASGDSVIRIGDPEGKKRTYGIELQFQKRKYDHLYFNFAASLFNSENKYTNGEWYRDEKNVQGTFTGVVGSNFLKHHGLSLRASASNGLPYSRHFIIQNSQGQLQAQLDTTEAFYSHRFDPLVSFSLRYNFKIFRDWGNVTGYLDILNILNYTPTLDRWFNGREWLYETANGIMPVGGITVDF